MKFLFPMFEVFGLGAAELIVIAIILGVIAALAVVVIWVVIALARSGRRDSSVATHAQKKCPDCAEHVRAEARVCKHCGYRFDVEPTKV
jgi:hypothetical protein